MQMGEEEVDVVVAAVQLQVDVADSRARVEDDVAAVREVDLHARRVAAVAHLVLPRAGKRAACAADAQLHQEGRSQKIDSAPLWPP